MTAVVSALLSESAARKLTADIRKNGDKLVALMREAHDRKAWAALGYTSWSAYVDAELPFSRSTSYRYLSAAPEQDALVAGRELSHGETNNSSNGQVVDAVDVDQRPLDTITPDAVLPPPAKKSGGARATAAPTADKRGDSSLRSAPPDPPERLPTIRQQTATIVAAMLNLAPDDAGPVLTAEDATVVKGWADRTVRAWQQSLGIESADKPARSPGQVIRPKDRKAKAAALGGGADPATCAHPKSTERHTGYAIVCGGCGKVLR